MFYKILERKKKKRTEQWEDNLNGITRITTFRRKFSENGLFDEQRNRKIYHLS